MSERPSFQVRDRFSDRLTVGRAKLEAKRSGFNVIILIVGAAITIGGAAFLLANVAPNRVSSSREVAFAVSDAAAVKPGLNEVRVKGIPAGRISDVKLENGHPVIYVQIRKKYGEVYNNAHAELRPNSALEDQFIDVVDRGTKSAGVANKDRPLAASQTDSPVGVDDVLQTFDSDTRQHLRVMLADLGKGLTDRGAQLQSAFVQVTPLLQVAGRITSALRARKPMTERLVHNTGLLTTELANRDQQLRTLVSEGSATLGTLSSGSRDLEATLAELPPTLTSIDTSFKATRGVLGDVNGAVRSLSPVADKLDGSLRAVRKLSDDADPAVTKLQTPVAKLVPLARSLQPLSSNLSTAITRVRPQVPVIDRTALDLVKCKKGIQGFFQWDASISKLADSNGEAPRGNVAIGTQSGGFPGLDEAPYQGCTVGGSIGARPPAEKDAH